MHIPDGFLNPRVWVPLDVVSVSFVAVALRRVSAAFEEKAVPLMGVVAAFIFAGQMINIPVAGGTSGHFLGGALAGSLLGPWAGLMIMTVVLVVQCFLFQDGGVAALGANIFNMGILGAMLGAALYRLGLQIFKGPRRVFWAGAVAGWMTMVVSAFSCAVQLGVSHVISWSAGLGIIVGLHTVMGILEGLVTGGVLESLGKSRPDLLRFEHRPFTKRDWAVWLLVLAVLGALVPFSSEVPDALQKLLGTL
jgi:cobalt/nickel transport system permease protein